MNTADVLIEVIVTLSLVGAFILAAYLYMRRSERQEYLESHPWLKYKNIQRSPDLNLREKGVDSDPISKPNEPKPIPEPRIESEPKPKPESKPEPKPAPKPEPPPKQADPRHYEKPQPSFSPPPPSRVAAHQPATGPPPTKIHAFYNQANAILRIALFSAVLWPLLAIVAALLLTPQNAQTIVPLVTLSPLIPMFLFLLGAPFKFFLLWQDPDAKTGFLWLTALIGVELSIGVYFAIIPVSKDVRLVPLLILTSFALLFLYLANIAHWLRNIFALLIILITLVFIFGGRARVYNAITTINPAPDNHPVSSTPPPPPERRPSSATAEHCSEDELQNFSSNTADTVTVTLQDEGCFHGPIVLNPRWKSVNFKHSHNPGDWVQILCNGDTSPRAMHPAWQDFYDSDVHNCFADGDISVVFFAKGQGEIYLHANSWK